MNWQPIETAPRDGTHILVYLACAPNQRVWDDWHLYLGRYTIGFWFQQRWEPLEPGGLEYVGTGSWKSIETKDCGTMGSEYTGWMQDVVPIDIEPTHWIPLPEPPK